MNGSLLPALELLERWYAEGDPDDLAVAMDALEASRLFTLRPAYRRIVDALTPLSRPPRRSVISVGDRVVVRRSDIAFQGTVIGTVTPNVSRVRRKALEIDVDRSYWDRLPSESESRLGIFFLPPGNRGSVYEFRRAVVYGPVERLLRVPRTRNTRKNRSRTLAHVVWDLVHSLNLWQPDDDELRHLLLLALQIRRSGDVGSDEIVGGPRGRIHLQGLLWLAGERTDGGTPSLRPLERFVEGGSRDQLYRDLLDVPVSTARRSADARTRGIGR